MKLLKMDTLETKISCLELNMEVNTGYGNETTLPMMTTEKQLGSLVTWPTRVTYYYFFSQRSTGRTAHSQLNEHCPALKCKNLHLIQEKNKRKQRHSSPPCPRNAGREITEKSLHSLVITWNWKSLLSMLLQRFNTLNKNIIQNKTIQEGNDESYHKHV